LKPKRRENFRPKKLGFLKFIIKDPLTFAPK
jgi:hypothetical protein